MWARSPDCSIWTRPRREIGLDATRGSASACAHPSLSGPAPGSLFFRHHSSRSVVRPHSPTPFRLPAADARDRPCPTALRTGPRTASDCQSHGFSRARSGARGCLAGPRRLGRVGAVLQQLRGRQVRARETPDPSSGHPCRPSRRANLGPCVLSIVPQEPVRSTRNASGTSRVLPTQRALSCSCAVEQPGGAKSGSHSPVRPRRLQATGLHQRE